MMDFTGNRRLTYKYVRKNAIFRIFFSLQFNVIGDHATICITREISLCIGNITYAPCCIPTYLQANESLLRNVCMIDTTQCKTANRRMESWQRTKKHQKTVRRLRSVLERIINSTTTYVLSYRCLEGPPGTPSTINRPSKSCTLSVNGQETVPLKITRLSSSCKEST